MGQRVCALQLPKKQRWRLSLFLICFHARVCKQKHHDKHTRRWGRVDCVYCTLHTSTAFVPESRIHGHIRTEMLEKQVACTNLKSLTRKCLEGGWGVKNHSKSKTICLHYTVCVHRHQNHGWQWDCIFQMLKALYKPTSRPLNTHSHSNDTSFHSKTSWVPVAPFTDVVCVVLRWQSVCLRSVNLQGGNRNEGRVCVCVCVVFHKFNIKRTPAPIAGLCMTLHTSPNPQNYSAIFSSFSCSFKSTVTKCNAVLDKSPKSSGVCNLWARGSC